MSTCLHILHGKPGQIVRQRDDDILTSKNSPRCPNPLITFFARARMFSSRALRFVRRRDVRQSTRILPPTALNLNEHELMNMNA